MARMGRYSALALSAIIGTEAVLAAKPANAQTPSMDIFRPTPDKQLKALPYSDLDILNAKPHINTLSPPASSTGFQYSSPTGPQAEPLKPSSPDGLSHGLSRYAWNRAFGSLGIPYSSVRVELGPGTSSVNQSSKAYLSSTYPYRAVGKLVFDLPGGGKSFCSASLIRKSVLVTAAHCVQEFGSGSTAFRNFRFIPGAYDAIKPYGIWASEGYVVPSKWANGTDIGTGSARDNDLAIFLIAKKDSQFIGQKTGWLTYAANNYSFTKSSKTGNLSTAELYTLGYPGLSDRGKIMQVSSGPSYTLNYGSKSTKQIRQGSNFTGGSSGGPWIANFGYKQPTFSSGASAGTQSAPNVVVGVTSWGSANPNLIKDNYSSQFAQNSAYPLSSYGKYGPGNIGSLINTACLAKPSGSTATYAALGYCD